MNYETYFSTKQQTPEEKTRFSPTDENQGWTIGAESAPEKRPKNPVCLKPRGFPKSVRITQRRDFLCVYRDGCRVSGRHVVLFGLENQRTITRMGVTASKKTGNAVRRARAKRRIREVFRQQDHDIKTSGLDIVVNVRWTTAEVPWSALVEDFQRCMRRLLAKCGS